MLSLLSQKPPSLARFATLPAAESVGARCATPRIARAAIRGSREVRSRGGVGLCGGHAMPRDISRPLVKYCSDDLAELQCVVGAGVANSRNLLKEHHAS